MPNKAQRAGFVDLSGAGRARKNALALQWPEQLHHGAKLQVQMTEAAVARRTARRPIRAFIAQLRRRGVGLLALSSGEVRGGLGAVIRKASPDFHRSLIFTVSKKYTVSGSVNNTGSVEAER